MNTNLKQTRAIARLLRLVSKVLTWALQGFNLVAPGPSRDYQNLLDRFTLVLKTRGPTEFLKFIKGVRTGLLAYLSGKPVRVDGVRSTKSGIPLILGPFIKRISGSEVPTGMLQLLNTILFSTRALKLGRLPDITPLTDPASGGVSIDGQYLKSFWKEMGYLPSQKVPKSLRFTSYHLTTKAGPNGHALFGSLRDLYILPESLLESIKYLGGEVITNRLEVLLRCRDLLMKILPVQGSRYRKVVWFPDKETKVRVIAELDYWSQTVLKPLHTFLFRVLKKIPQDCTFDQGSFKDKLNGATVFYSIDLTAATDRFPIAVIEQVLGAKLPTTYMSHWRNIMVGFPFDSQLGKISYAVGNPMGAYSSWASFAVAHHYLVYYCIRKLNLQWKQVPYCLLGDDIVIGHKDVAELYLSLVKSLGVEVSELKTHTSQQLYEFAKRLVYKGQEISPFPISALSEVRKKSYLITNLLIELEVKGWISKDGIPSLVGSFYGIIDGLPSRIRQKLIETSHLCELIVKTIRGSISAQDCLNTIARQFEIPIRHLEAEESLGILQSLAVEAFAKSNPENDPPPKEGAIGLGPLAISLVEIFTGLEGTPWEADGFELIYALPLLGCYGLVEEMFMKLKREALRIDRSGGDWSIVLRTMALPLDDRILTERPSHQLSRVSAVLGKHVKERLEFILQIDPSFIFRGPR